MARAHRFAAVAVLISAVYLLLFFALLPVPFISSQVIQEILPVVSTAVIASRSKYSCQPVIQLPWWLLVAFGSYSLWSLGMGLFTFRDCPEAYEELMKVRFIHLPDIEAWILTSY
jgi:dolichol-phosphate mannosyltransferase subunit 3